MSKIGGEWETRRHQGGASSKDGWGAELGYPGLVLDADGEDIHGTRFQTRKIWNEH